MYSRGGSHTLPTALRTRPALHSGRRELARARLPQRRRDSAFHRARRRVAHLRCRRERIHRLYRLLGAADPRSSSSRNPRRAEPRDDARHQLRRADRTGDRTRRNGPRDVPFDRDGPAGQFRHRSHHERAARGPRIHQPGPDGQVRWLLSRARRFPAGESRVGCGDPRAARFPRRPERLQRHHADRSVQRRRGGGSRLSTRTATRSPR